MKTGRPPSRDWTATFQVCTGCPEKGLQPLDNFYRDAYIPNGRMSRCKVCKRKETIDREVTRIQTARKGNQMSMPIWKWGLTGKSKVMLAIERGATNQAEIRRVTRLPEDVICDLLADLYDEGKLDRRSLKARVYRLCA